MNKKLLILIITLVIALPIISGCTLRVAVGSRFAADIPHAVDDVRFNNCLSCHAADMLSTIDAAIDHVYEGFTNKDCSRNSDCHARPDGSYSTP